MIDQRFLDDLAQDLKLPEDTPTPEMQLASANTGVTTDGGAFVGYRLNMPKGLNTIENQAKQSVLIADTMAGAGKGMIQAFPGLPGDLESIGRMALGYLGYNVDENTVLPTSEEIGKRLESVLGPVIPPNQTTGVPTAERVRAAGGGELGGEIVSPGGQIALAGKVAKPVIGATKKIIETGKDLPVGMSIKGVDESLDPLGFYSAASKAVDNIAQEKGTGQQFLAQIEKTPGVKKEELLWTGLDDFLKGRKSVTKAEVQDYLNSNRVEVKEVQLGDLKFNTQSEYALPEVVNLLKKEQGTSYDNMRLVLENDYNAYQALTKKFPNLEDTDNWSDRVLSELIDTNSGAARFEKFTLPGGKNYREIYLTLPVKNLTEQEARVVLGAKPDAKLSEADINYASRKNQYLVPRAHSASPEADVNRLAQIRVNDRVDVDGKKVLFVEEVQSDWHQAGRKQGYDTPESKATMQKRVDELEAEREKLYTEQARLEKLAEPFTSQGQDAPSNILDQWNKVSNRLNNLSREWSSAKNALATGGNLVPDAPFKGNWHELALKRAIQLASEGGYDRIAFTTGKTQAERYDLSKQISKISYEKGDNGMYDLIANDMDGTEILFKEDIPLSEVEDIIGKDMAKKIANDEGKPGDGTGYRNWKTFRGVDLQVGGEGMKGFYDSILPKYLDKYGKKWDAKTGMTEIPTEKTRDASGMPSMYPGKASVHYMDITPKMRESVLTKGQPLFQMAPAIPAGAAGTQMQEESK
jgi:hypothetical protein